MEGDDHGEAYTAIMWGVGVSHESDKIAGAETFSSVEGNTCGAVKRGAVVLPGSRATSRMKRNASEPGRSHVRPDGVSHAGPHREGEEP